MVDQQLTSLPTPNEDWSQVEMRHVVIVTTSLYPGQICDPRGRPSNAVCVVFDRDNHSNVTAVLKFDDLLDLVPALHPESVTYGCTETERPVLDAIVGNIKAQLFRDLEHPLH